MKRYLIILMFVFIMYDGFAAVYESAGHTAAVYENDILVLKKRLHLDAKDRTALERIIKLLYVCEMFDEAARYADQYLKYYSAPDIEYLKALSLASSGKYSDSINSLQNILSDKSLSPAERKSIELKIEIFKKGISTGGIPSGAELTEWGKDAYAAGIIDRRGILVAARSLSGEYFLYSIDDNKIINKLKEVQFQFPEETKLLAVSVSPDGREIFATCRKGDKSIAVMHRRFDIETDKWTEWSQPDFANAGSVNGFANMLGDGEHVLFISNRNAQTGLDIYIVRRNEKGTWDNPVLLDGVNTAMDECSVYLHPDGETVYFSTNGRGGSGGYDLYSGSLSSLKGKFSINNIVNMKHLNTFRNEFFPLYAHGPSGKAFHSFRRNNDSVICNVSDIAGATPVMFLDIVTLDSSTKSPVRADIRLVRIGDRTTGISLRSIPDLHGRYPFTVRKNSSYSVEITAEGYAYHKETIETAFGNDSATKTVYLQKGKIKEGYTFSADNIYFDSGSAKIRPESLIALERLYDFMKNNSGVKIEISGHTDNLGGLNYNLELSRKRAEAVAEYLFARGVKKNRITLKGYGYSSSAAANDNEINRQKNRRVEITVKSSD
ncbi:MAG: OmpA family protein [Spirochaetes bacterium]|nr:OmpA family protein [Spirochaetota bacterium]